MGCGQEGGDLCCLEDERDVVVCYLIIADRAFLVTQRLEESRNAMDVGDLMCYLSVLSAMSFCVEMVWDK